MRYNTFLFSSTLFCVFLLCGAAACEEETDRMTFFIRPIGIEWTEKVTLSGDWLQSGELHIEMDTQSICFSDYQGLEGLRTYYEQFLELRFDQRCGTGCDIHGYALICVLDGRLQSAVPSDAMISSYHPADECMSDSTDNPGMTSEIIEYGYFVSQVDSLFELTMIRHFTFDSPCAADSDITDTAKLAFNQEFGVFCSGLDTLDGCFGPFVLSNIDTMKCKSRNGLVAPVFRPFADSGSYYFVDGAWCFYSEEANIYFCGRGRDCFYDR